MKNLYNKGAMWDFNGKYHAISGAIISVALFALVMVSSVYAAEAPGGDPGGAAGDLPSGLTNETAYQDTEIPIIYSREIWEGWEHAGDGWKESDTLKGFLTWLPQPDNAPPDYSPVDRIILHDQGCLNPSQCTKNARDFPVRTIQNIYRSHAVSRGWGDIGYNYIIDLQGRIYEGRYGGNGVRGAHVYANRRCENLNVGSAGVLLLGDLRAGPMSDAQSESVARLGAWLGAVNGFEPAEISATSVIWKNPKNADSSCNLGEGGFNGVITAGRIVSHGDVEIGNSDKFILSTERQASKVLYAEFVKYAYEREGDTQAYMVLDGVAHEAPVGTNKVALINKSQLLMFPKATVAALPNGSLVKSENRNRIYVIKAGERRPIPAADLFESNGFDWDKIEYVSDRELALWRIGEPLAYPDGTLVRGEDTEEVYVFDAGKLRHITSAQLFTKLKFSWENIKVLSVVDVRGYQNGEPKNFPDGTLLRGQGPRVYLLAGGKKQPIYSASVFRANKLDWGAILVMTDSEIDIYEDGPPLSYPDGSIVRADNEERVYLLQTGFRRWIETAEVLLGLGYGWSDIGVVTVAELASTPLAQSIPTIVASKQNPVPTNEPEPKPEPEPEPTPTPEPPSGPVELPEGEEPIIRIGLAAIGEDVEHLGSTVKLTYDRVFKVLKNGVVVSENSGGEIYSFTPQGSDKWRIEPTLDPLDPLAGVVTISSYSNPAYDGNNDNRFRGAIDVQRSSDGALWIIDELKMESYLKGVAETVNGEHPEYAKAFAIAARSYALNHLGAGGKRAGEPFTLRRTPEDQLYKGVNYELRASDPVTAVAATRGMVATYNGKPIRSAYSSGAPGPTLDSCDVFGGAFCGDDFNYLRGGVGDPAGTEYNYTSCGGANHCVGIDAAGGRRMAELEVSGINILRKYYSGIMIENRW